MNGRVEGEGSVLVVDDEKIIVRILEAALPDMGYRCMAVNSGDAALRLIKQTVFDIMLTDVHMPGMNGFELTEEAKRITPDLHVIIMTEFSKSFSYDAAIEAGAADFIKKPFTVNELEARIEHVRVQEKMRRMSLTDELTGLSNRWGFFALAEQAMRQSHRTGKRFLLLYAKVDSLRDINDILGAPEGDQALLGTATILRAACRKSDIIARIGEDEFAVITREADNNDGQAIAKRLRTGLENYNEWRDGGHRLSVSFGITYLDPAESRSIDTLLVEEIASGIASGDASGRT